jgi:glycosyltransferase involved in cell wall biosynthesis
MSYGEVVTGPMNTLVTVVIPSYNHEQFIATAVDSCLSQTYRNLEIVVVDDGSQDSSVELLETRYAGDRRVRLLTQQHKGAHAAINEGIRQASGTYIAILNSDDVFHDRRIEVLIQEAQKVQGLGALIFSDLECVDDNRQPVQEHERAIGYRVLQQLCQQKAIENVFLVGNIAITSSNFFFSKALYDSVGEFTALRYTHDWEWALRATLGRPPIWVRENLLSYRVHGSNTILEGDLWRHIHENAFIHAKAISAFGHRFASADDVSAVTRDAYISLLQNESFFPLATLYFVMQLETGLREAKSLEMVSVEHGKWDLQCLAEELNLPSDPFLSVRHIAAMKVAMASQAALIEERWAAMQQMEAIIRERDETIASQAQLIEERWAAMQQMEAIIRERDETIASQAQLIEERWAAMQHMIRKIDGRDRWIADLQERLANADKTMASQVTLIDERWAAMQHMSQEIDSRDRWIADLQGRLDEARRELSVLKEIP